MTFDEIRQVWIQLSGEMSAEVMYRYRDQRIGSGGREGLGIYGMSQERIARKRVQIAVKLLRKNGFDSSIGNIRKITQQSRSTIERYFPTQIQKSKDLHKLASDSAGQSAEVITLGRS